VSLVEHAIYELTALGQFEEDPAFSQSLVAAIAAFASYGHSGGSAFAAIEMLHELLQFHALTPLTDNPEEWVDVTEMSGSPMWQNRRQSDAFSYDGGKTYYTLDERDRLGDMELTPFHDSVHWESLVPPVAL
jgi:hypothetical protein